MKKGILILLSWSLPFVLLAQTDTSHGIIWAQGLTWEQVKQKAKHENKYIFVDCFTTWCGPCKLMDKQVYNSETVGKLFNEKFINVKLQMDKTKIDNEEIKSWYVDAGRIGKDYHIEGYPTFIFLSPQGTLVNKDLGFKDVNTFISVANTALTPGMKFEDPYASYDSLIAKYKNGKRDYDRYPFMITMAAKNRQVELQDQLLKELTDYLVTVEKEKRYTKERIEMWDQLTFSSNSRTFQWIYKDAKMIDAVVRWECKQSNLTRLHFNNKGWAETMVDKTIQAEIVAPFFAEQNKDPKIAMSGSYLNDPTGKILKRDSNEANWSELKKRIEEKYNSDYTERNLRIAKVEWYTRHLNYEASVPAVLHHLNKDFNLEHDNPSVVNHYAWEAFEHSDDKEVINGYIKWMKRVVTTKGKNSKNKGAMFDTYANLLYKDGQKEEAIAWEEKAVNSSPANMVFAQTLEKMKQGEPTWTTNK